MTRIAQIALVGFFALLGIPALVQGPAAAGATATAIQPTEDGAQIFADNCSSCHQAYGQGIPGKYPQLAANPAATDPAFVESVIREGLTGPIEVLGVGYNDTMPAVALTDAEVAAVVAHVTTLAQAPPIASTPAGAAGPPNSDRGQALFVGSTSFSNGGPACAACHVAGTVDGLGGPTLGPDLTHVLDRLGGQPGLVGWLATPPSPVMTPIFSEKPLAEQEIVDVVAFLAEASTQTPASNTDFMTALGLAGTAVLFVGLAIASRGLRRTYVERLRSTP
ncbi:MAG: c-type cytochrome [Acidimicrobiia bacterium]|nr:c-type cytochrome [Acidimicrobiia bacterium]